MLKAHINHRHIAVPVPSLSEPTQFPHIMASVTTNKPPISLQDSLIDSVTNKLMGSAPQRIKSHIGPQPSVGDPRIQHSVMVVPVSSSAVEHHRRGPPQQSPPPPPPPPFVPHPHRPPNYPTGPQPNTQNPPPNMRTNLITVPIQDNSSNVMDHPPPYHHYPPQGPQYSPYGVPPPPVQQPQTSYYQTSQPNVVYQGGQYGGQGVPTNPPPNRAPQYQDPGQYGAPPPPHQWAHPSNPQFYR
uniref:Uncharacterized protein n=1 Tax=Timema tahoe TaxID=61484 RepID=A0A7R9IHQ6_9NEOP|nr:unnamed protein product [Timema tahoe]